MVKQLRLYLLELIKNKMDFKMKNRGYKWKIRQLSKFWKIEFLYQKDWSN